MPGGEISPEEVKTRFNDARAKVISLISDWEKSGNGFGQRREADSDFGHMTEDHLQDGDVRSSFLKDWKGQKEHHLCLWHLADSLGILCNVVNVLSKIIAVSLDEPVSTVASITQNKRTRTALLEEERSRATEREGRAMAFQEQVGWSLNSMAISQQEALLLKLQERCDEIQLRVYDATDSEVPISIGKLNALQ